MTTHDVPTRRPGRGGSRAEEAPRHHVGVRRLPGGRHRPDRRARPDPGRGGRGSPPAIGCSTSPPDPATSPSRRHRPGAEVIGLRPDARNCWTTGERPRPTAGVAARPGSRRRRGAALSPTREFDAVLSCVGVMFAPHHQASRRRTGPGLPARRHHRPDLTGRRSGFIGQMFAAMKPYAPPPPPGAQPPPLWGNEEHVRTLLGDRVDSVTARDAEADGDAFRHAGGVPRLLQGRLRPDDRGVQGDRGRPGQGRGAGRGARRAGPALRPEPGEGREMRTARCSTGSTCC